MKFNLKKKKNGEWYVSLYNGGGIHFFKSEKDAREFAEGRDDVCMVDEVISVSF